MRTTYDEPKQIVLNIRSLLRNRKNVICIKMEKSKISNSSKNKNSNDRII